MNPDGASGPLFWSVPKVGSSIGLVCVVSGAAMVHVGRSVSNGQDETGKRKWFLYYGLRAFFSVLSFSVFCRSEDKRNFSNFARSRYNTSVRSARTSSHFQYFSTVGKCYEMEQEKWEA